MQLLNLNNAYFLKQNDTATQIQMKVVDYDGLTPIALDGFASLEVVIGSEFGRFVTKTPTLLPENGAFEFGLDEGDILPSGTQRLEFHMISLNGERRVAPSKGFYKMKVEQGIDEFQAVVTTVTLQLALDSIEEQSLGLQGQYDDFISVAQPLVDASIGAVTDAETALVRADLSLATSQQVLVDVGDTIPLAQQATANANTATGLANTATTNANTATTNANTAKSNADIATNLANTATTNATNAKTATETATINATTATENATTQANYALTQGNYAKNQADTLAGKQSAVDKAIVDGINSLAKATTAEANSNTAITTANLAKSRADLIIGQTGDSNTEIVDSRLGADLIARATSGTLVREIHANQLETARQTTTLNNGVSVISGGVDALADVEIEGRTLISLPNSNLEATKQYVVADKKTKVIVDGVTQSGVAKFTKGTTTVSTANYLGKVPGSTVANPHVAKYGAGGSLYSPSNGAFLEISSNSYSYLQTLNGINSSTVTTVNGAYAMQPFSFDIVQEIERKLGIIPKSTLAEKVQWIKDNVESTMLNWHGFGSSVGGNKATISAWYGVAYAMNTSHLNGTVAKLSINPSPATYVQSDGMLHVLAYADPSDGVTPSSISTDYIDLVVTLKSTAQLNTRPTIIRVENFEGKVTGSVVENPHVSKRTNTANNSAFNALMIPSNGSWGEFDNTYYGTINTLNVVSGGISNTNAGHISQQLFSFNLIEAIERNIGKIPRTSVADKVQWLKDNLNKITPNWHGFGSSVGGNKASFDVWSVSKVAWDGFPVTNTTGAVAKLTKSYGSPSSIVDVNGFVHFLAYAEPSDGTTASTINTDFIDLEIELKPTADFTRPKVALYEVTADSYAKILVDWNADEVVNRYPSVEGVQHLQGVGVIAEGENLLPPFTEWSLHPNAKVISPYELEMNGVGANLGFAKALPNQQYTITFPTQTNVSIVTKDKNGVDTVVNGGTTTTEYTFTTNSSATIIQVNCYGATGTINFKNPMLTLGNVAKPFVPRNPSYSYADVKLGAIGTVADRLYEQDGAKFVRKVVEKDVVLGGDLAWSFSFAEDAGFKKATAPVTGVSVTFGSSIFRRLSRKKHDKSY